ncbi:hypothetical protein [Rhodococcus sp. ACT016]|uniref:hypothetical protein n=1 Tax=Rhodococcus sp. ACT016 TaxID=3134808 RepID=UPI003D26FBF7
MDLRYLRIAAHVELASLIVMLVNLATLHLKPISSLLGPTHGVAYLAVFVLVWRCGRATAGIRCAALVPGVGGLVALRLLERRAGPVSA